jgi:heat-inducible transcriptional repressor
MLSSGERLQPARQRLDLSLVRRELDEAMRAATQTLSQVTNLLAVVSGPSLNSASVRRVEVLALQPQVVLVVIITSTGGVSKMLATFERAVDPGLVTWAGEYLNERLVGLGLGSRMLHQRLLDPSLAASETAFLQRFVPAFNELCSSEGEEELYVEGTARLFSTGQMQDTTQVNELINMLERRVVLLRVLREALAEPGVYVRIGHENEIPAMRSLAVVATGYGMPRRRLGTVSVIGPVRMDYACAIATVRDAAGELSRFVEDAYAEN